MLYTYICPKCGKEKDVIRKVEDRNETLICECYDELMTGSKYEPMIRKEVYKFSTTGLDHNVT